MLARSNLLKFTLLLVVMVGGRTQQPAVAAPRSQVGGIAFSENSELVSRYLSYDPFTLSESSSSSQSDPRTALRTVESEQDAKTRGPNNSRPDFGRRRPVRHPFRPYPRSPWRP